LPNFYKIILEVSLLPEAIVFCFSAQAHGGFAMAAIGGANNVCTNKGA
jgi:hypothetical protein